MNNREASKLFEFKKDGKGYSVVRYLGTESHVIIPTQYRKKAVVKIEVGVFDDKSIELITIPSTVVNMQPQYCDVKIKLEDGNATYEVINNCLVEKATKKAISGGKYSVIPDGVMEIGDEAFSGTSIESVTIPSTVEKIGWYAFNDCKNLKTVTLNEGLKSIGKNAFSGTSIESITIPSTVEGIGFDAFSGCSKLTQIDCKLRKSYVESNRNDFRGLLEKESIINWLNG